MTFSVSTDIRSIHIDSQCLFCAPEDSLSSGAVPLNSSNSALFTDTKETSYGKQCNRPSAVCKAPKSESSASSSRLLEFRSSDAERLSAALRLTRAVLRRSIQVWDSEGQLASIRSHSIGQMFLVVS